MGFMTPDKLLQVLARKVVFAAKIYQEAKDRKAPKDELEADYDRLKKYLDHYKKVESGESTDE